jgi:DNA segregation ATPase FtsK/SpoIIIE, S-DNA-T family
MAGTKFYRPPRNYAYSFGALRRDEVVIVAPPVVQPKQSGATVWLQLLVPLVGSFASFAFVLVYHTNLLIIIAAVGAALASVLIGVVMRIQQTHATKKRQQTDGKAYRDYLGKIRAEMEQAAHMQQVVADHLYPPASRLPSIVAQYNREQPQLWERRFEDRDFLQVRVGTGSMNLSRPVRVDLGPNPFIQYIPELQAEAEQLVNEYTQLAHSPIPVELASAGTLAVTGESRVTRALARAMLCQIAAFHSPEDVRIAAYFPPDAASEWDWLKWLPHTRRLFQTRPEKQYAPEPLCLLADNAADFQDIFSKQIAPELARRHQLSEDKGDAAGMLMKPHLVIVLDGFSTSSSIGQLPDIQKFFLPPEAGGLDPARHRVTVICLVNSIRQEPSTIRARITVGESGQLEFQTIQVGGSRLEGIQADSPDVQTAGHVARALASFSLADKDAQQDLSQDIHLLPLLNVISADMVQTRDTWKPRKERDLLRVPIGRQDSGAPLLLDLKEAADKGMGPHGLVVGATGSGKSELLRTLVISLAVMHDPNTVNFVLIDFKGGASFADFAALPHVAGIVTNLKSDLSLVDRVYKSLQGEQERRQRMLREAGNLSKIKEYQAKWRANPAAMEPMPHLMIIVDEFAELISSRADFLDLFVGIGRVGRSLGMHLLLATQRLEEGRLKGLETYLSYRLCLRTFSATESNIALGTPDAFYLPSAPGVGYCKFETSITLFKTALISTPFIAAQEQKRPLALIREFTPTGRLVPNAAALARLGISVNTTTGPLSMSAEQAPTEMATVIHGLADSWRAQPQHVPVHQVSLPPLRKDLTLATVLKQYCRSDLDGSRWLAAPPFGSLRVPIGLLDKPQEQAQEPLFLDFSGTGGHLALVGAPQSGKSTLLRAIVAAFIATHTPRDVQFYCIDLGGGLLRAFEDAPHVGSVCINSKLESDKIRRLVRQVRKVIEDRSFFFQQQRIDGMATFRARRQAGELASFPFGDVFLVIDNMAQLNQDIEQLRDEIIELAATGLNYGVHVIIAANRWAEIAPKIRDNIGARLELYLHDPVESEFGKAAAATLPAGVPGRGLTRDKLHFQAALPVVVQGNASMTAADTTPALDALPVQEAIEAFVRRAQHAWSGPTALPVRMLPGMVRWQDLSAAVRPPARGIPLGVDEFRLEPVLIDLAATGPHFLVFGDGECGKTNLIRAWIRGIERYYSPEEAEFAIIDLRRKLADLRTSQQCALYAYNQETLKQCIDGLRATIDRRVKESAQMPLERLDDEKKWDGPRFFVFVDDYDAFPTSANPLAPLNNYLVQARDTGFHLILARSVGGTTTSFDPILKTLKDMQTPGLVMSGNPTEGVILGNQRAAQFPPGRGYLIRRKYPITQIQTACISQ